MLTHFPTGEGGKYRDTGKTGRPTTVREEIPNLLTLLEKKRSRWKFLYLRIQTGAGNILCMTNNSALVATGGHVLSEDTVVMAGVQSFLEGSVRSGAAQAGDLGTITQVTEE